MLIFTQTLLKFAPDTINNVGNGSMPDPDMRQEGFLLFVNPALGVKTWISITPLWNSGAITHACLKSSVEVKGVNNG